MTRAAASPRLRIDNGGDDVSGLFRFRPREHIRRGSDFERVYRAGGRAGDGLFAVNALPNGFGHARLGLSVSARTVGNAVRRNRVRRIVREVFRHLSGELGPLDLVVTSRPGARAADRGALVDSLERLLREAGRKAAASAVSRS